MNTDISNKVVVITGSSRGIGSELALAFAKERAIVVINYCHSKEKAKGVYKQVLKYSTNSIMICADVTNPYDVATMCCKVVEKFGRVDILINNAGICDDNLIHMMSLCQWKKVIDVNLTGTFLCCKEFSKIMINQCVGKIINIASIKGQNGSVGQVNYSASKAGVIGLTKALAKELGQFNISVNAVCPGFIVTDLNRYNAKKIEIAKKKSLLSFDNALKELIDFIIYASSDSFSQVSGRIFNIDSRMI